MVASLEAAQASLRRRRRASTPIAGRQAARAVTAPWTAGVVLYPNVDARARAATCSRRASSASRRAAPARASCRSSSAPAPSIRPFTTIYAGSTFGARLQTGQGASIREDNVLGDDVSIGTNAVLEFGNRIGNRVRIHSGCFLELVTIEDDVFVGPNVVFTDDPHPMNCPRYEECKGGAVVRRLARIGANSTILPGVEIGEGALVGAGSVVVHDVPAGAVVAGSPAQVIKQVADLTCPPGWFERPYVLAAVHRGRARGALGERVVTQGRPQSRRNAYHAGLRDPSGRLRPVYTPRFAAPEPGFTSRTRNHTSSFTCG